MADISFSHPVTEPVTAAVRAVRAQCGGDRVLQTAGMLAALAEADALGCWQLIWSQANYPSFDELRAAFDPVDAEPGVNATWDDCPISAALASALEMIERLCDASSLQ